MRSWLLWLCLLFLPLAAVAQPAEDLESEMIQVADMVFSGNGTPEMIEWQDFTFQLMPDVDPVDIGAMWRPGSVVGEDQRKAAQQVFLKGQGLAQMMERGGKTVTQFLLGKNMTLAIHEHSNSPALIFFNGVDATRRFDFVRRDGVLRLARVSLRHPSERD